MLKFEIYKRTLYEDNNIINILNIEKFQSKQEEKIIKYCIYFKIRYFKTTNLHAVSFNFKVAKEILHLDSLFFLLMVQNYSIK